MRLALVLLLLAGCASPAKDDGAVQIRIPAEKAAECQAAGGCGLLTLAKVQAMLQQAHDEGVSEGMGEMDSHGCRRGST
jgi:hypothetical protein